MISQMVLSPEGLPADIAGIGPLIRVRPFMDQQIITFGELPIAIFADELFLGLDFAGHQFGLKGRPSRPSHIMELQFGVIKGRVLQILIHNDRTVVVRDVGVGVEVGGSFGRVAVPRIAVSRWRR